MSFGSLYQDWETRRPEAEKAKRYIECKQTGRNTSVLAPPELRTMYFTGLRWAWLVTGALEERLSIVDLVCADLSLAKFMRDRWRDLDGDLISSRVHTEALTYGRAYVAVTSKADGSPFMTMLTALSTVHKLNPLTGSLREALRVYGDRNQYSTHYELGRTTHREKTNEGQWRITNTEEHAYDRLNIVLFTARSTATDGYGQPEAKAIWSLQDAGTRTATDGAIAGALAAVPQNVILNASEEATAGKSASQLYMSRILALKGSNVEIGQFAAAQLQQFGTLLTTFARQAASVMGVPVSIFGVASEANPSSGDAQRQDDSRITRRADRLARDFTPGWQEVLNILADYTPSEIKVTDAALRSLDVEWMKANAPTAGEIADLAVKYASAKLPNGAPVLSHRFILKKLGLTPKEIEEELEAAEDSVFAQMMRDDDNDEPPQPVQD